MLIEADRFSRILACRPVLAAFLLLSLHACYRGVGLSGDGLEEGDEEDGGEQGQEATDLADGTDAAEDPAQEPDIDEEPGPVFWSRTYGFWFSMGYWLISTSDGGFVTSAGIYTTGIMKLDSFGLVEWSMGYESTEWYTIVDFLEISPDRYLAVAEYREDVALLRLTAPGRIEGQIRYGTLMADKPSSMAVSDTTILLGGWTYVGGRVDPDAWLLALDMEGGITWERTFGTADGYDAFLSIAADESGFAACGRAVVSPERGDDAWVLKIDDGGEVTWQGAYGGSGGEQASQIHETADGGFVVLGITSIFGEGNWPLWVLRLDAAGDIVWQRAFWKAGCRIFGSVAEANSGGYIVVGCIYTDVDILQGSVVMRLDEAGGIVWQRTYQGALAGCATAVSSISGEGYIAVGGTVQDLLSNRTWIMKVSEDGLIGGDCPEGFGQDADLQAIETDASRIDPPVTAGQANPDVGVPGIFEEEPYDFEVTTQCEGY